MKGEQYTITNGLYGMISDLHQAVSDLNIVKGQAEAKLDLTDKAALPDELIEAGETLVENIDAWIETLLSTERSNFQDALNWPDQYLDYLHATFGSIFSAMPPLNRNQIEKYEELKARYPEVIGEFDRIITEDLGAFNTLYAELGLPAILIPGEEQEDQSTKKTETEESEDQ